MVIIFIGFISGIGWSYIGKASNMFFLTVIVFAVFICVIFSVFKKFNLTLLMVTILVYSLGGIYTNIQFEKVDPLFEYKESEVTLTGKCVKYQIIDEDFHKATVKRGRYKHLVHIYDMNERNINAVGSSITFTGEVELPSGRRNPGTFDYNLYLKANDIRTIVKCDSQNIHVSVPEFKDEPLNYAYNKIWNFKNHYLNQAKSVMSESSYGLLTGILFGSKDEMDDDVYEKFQKNGIAHILSVSGIHVGIIYGFLLKILGRRTNLGTAAIVFFALYVYAFLSEFSPSVIRASVMISIHIIAKLTNRPYDLLTGTCSAAMIMLFINPLSLFHVGFQLSFLAVFLLSFYIPFAKRYIGKKRLIAVYKKRFRGTDDLLSNKDEIKFKIANALTPLLILQIGMAPFSAYVFNHISLVGIFLNIPIIFIVGLIIPIGVSMIPILLINFQIMTDIFFTAGMKLIDLILKGMVQINNIAFDLPYNSLQVVSPDGWLLVLFYCALFFLCSETNRVMRSRNEWDKITIICITFVIISIFSYQSDVMKKDNSDFVFVDVGQGDCMHLRTPSGKNILIDSGGNVDFELGKKTLLPYLLKNGVKKIDYAFVTHLHTDHYQGLRELSTYMDIDRVYTYEANKYNLNEILKESGIKKNSLNFIGKGDRVNIDNRIYINVLYPYKKDKKDYLHDLEQEEDENKNSLFMKLNYGNQTFLITGDLDEEGEKIIMNELKNPEEELKSTILKVGHHGSKYSTSDDFLDMVDPKHAVIQVGKNTYGHPTPEVIEKLNNKGIMVYRNDLDGAIMLDYEDDSFNYTTTIDRTDNGIQRKRK